MFAVFCLFFFFSASVQDNNLFCLFFSSAEKEQASLPHGWLLQLQYPEHHLQHHLQQKVSAAERAQWRQHRRCLSLPAASSSAAQSPELSQAQVHPVPLSCCPGQQVCSQAPVAFNSCNLCRKDGKCGALKALKGALRHLWTEPCLAGWRRAVGQVSIILSALALLLPSQNSSYS